MPAAHLYSIFGLSLGSDRPLSLANGQSAEEELSISRRDELPPLRGALEVHRIAEPGQDGELVIRQLGLVVDVEHLGLCFRFDAARPQIAYVENGPGGERRFELLLERVVLPLYLMLSRSGLVALHGSAVSIGGRSWVFIGPPGAGKSTTALVLLEHGGRLLADDVAVIDVTRGLVLPAPPVLHLRQGTGAVAGATAEGAVVRRTDKRWYRLENGLGSVTPSPLRAVVSLDSSGTVVEPALEPMSGRAAAVALLDQAFDLTAAPPDWSTRRFRLVAELSRCVPIERLRYAPSADGRPRHVAGLLRHIERAA